MPRIYEILTILRSIISALFDSMSVVPFLTFIPFLLQTIIRDQLNHELYVLRKEWNEEYDYVVIGGGSGGSVMASRLSEDLSVSVLLLEAGIAENFLSDVPMASIILHRSPMDWSFKTTPQTKCCRGMEGHQSIWPRGKCMGGTSTINTMVYMRGNRRDYDKWAANGCDGWSWPEVFPYFIKSEDNRDPEYVATGYHGVGGPLTVTSSQDPRKADIAFQDSGAYIGYPSGDVNGESQSHFTIPQRTIRDGQRCSVAKAYLEPLVYRKNLKVLIKSYVTRIVFDDQKRAIGVEFDRFFGKYFVRVRREVILSAGTINSPKILMLSGVGPAEHLRELGITVVSDLRVGDNLQEHYLTGMSFLVNETIGIDILREASPANIFQYYLTKNNSLTNNLVEGTAFVKTKYADPNDDYPDVQLFMTPATLSTDFGLTVRAAQGLGIEEWKQVFKPYIGLHSIAIYPVVLRPYSRGWIRLRSYDAYDSPIIEPNIFGDDRDLDILVEGMKYALRVAQTPPFQRYNAQPFQTKFPGCEEMPIYSEQYLRCQAQTYTSITWHPAGTVKMGAVSDPTAVVDPQLRVKGVKGLRVVDASVMPTVVSGNLNAPTVMIAEKIADLMKGRQLLPFFPPMSRAMISRLPNLPYIVYREHTIQ